MAAKEEAEEEQGGIETKIEAALRSRLQHFKQNADSFTLERVRRLIEKDLELEKFALDVHKRFIKQSLEKQMENADDDGAPEDSKEKLEKDASSTKQEKEVAESPKRQVIEKDIKEATVVDEAQLEDSPIMGVMSSKSESADAQGGKASESTIKKAIWERAAHFRANSEYVSQLLVGSAIIFYCCDSLLPVLPTTAWGLQNPKSVEKDDFPGHYSYLNVALSVCSSLLPFTSFFQK